MYKLIAFALFCLAAPAVSAAETDLETHFREYIGQWKPDADIDAIVAKYWHSAATMFASPSPVQLPGRRQIAAALTSAMQPVIDEGWQGSSLVAFSSCRLRSDLALVGIDYTRRFANGTTTTDSAVYLVLVTERGWKIAAVMATDRSKVRC